MKKNIWKLMVLALMLFGFFNPLGIYKVKASEVTSSSLLSRISISQMPLKTTVAQGTELDLTGMVVEAYYQDGTKSVITDYEIINFNSSSVGLQAVTIKYKECITFFNITVIPAKMTNIYLLNRTDTSVTMQWEAYGYNTRYELYRVDDVTGKSFITSTYSNNIILPYNKDIMQKYIIRRVDNINGIDYCSEFSDEIIVADKPQTVSGLIVSGSSSSSVSLTWNQVAEASGYYVYRAAEGATEFTLLQTVSTNSFTDSNLKAAQGYQYKVCAYIDNNPYPGDFSSIVIVSTSPTKVSSIKYKTGDQKIRLSWSKVTGVSFYELYAGNDTNGYALIATVPGTETAYVAEGLLNGIDYSLYIVTCREYNGLIYRGEASSSIKFLLEAAAPTSTEAKLFPTEVELYASDTYAAIPFFNTNLNLERSFIIPGLINTDIGGFTSTRMCPQGMTFAYDYLLISAYDLAAEENSVIYVMDKVTKELLTTLILPSKTHAGGLAFDGSNIWVPTGKKVSAIPLKVIDEAALNGEPYYYVTYKTTKTLAVTVSFLTYYDNQLWVGSYNELKNTYMYSYELTKKETKPSLKKKSSIYLPTRVQGIAFTEDGALILSRSCQLYKGLRGYMRQLDVYRPDYANAVNNEIPLRECVYSVEMPSMNEGIALDDGFIYVLFESAAFEKASYKMDRICAFDINSIIPSKQE